MEKATGGIHMMVPTTVLQVLAGSAFGPFGFGSIAHGDELPTVVQRPLPDEGDSECDHGGPQDCKTLLLVLLVLGVGLDSE